MNSAFSISSPDIIRQRIRKKRHEVRIEWIQQTSKVIEGKVMELNEWRNANWVFCYFATVYEVQTSLLIKNCLAAGKQLCVPAFHRIEGVYKLARLSVNDSIRPGYGNIAEPVEPIWLKSVQIDLAIIPGIAFDRTGSRIGHGSGHFDRLLAQEELVNSFKVGLAFEWQLVKKIVLQPHDIRLNAVVTEKRVYSGNK